MSISSGSQKVPYVKDLVRRERKSLEDLRKPMVGSNVRRKKRKVHSLIDKIYSRRNLELAWERVKSRKGCGGIDEVTIEKFEEKKDYYLDLLHQKLKEGTYQPKPVKRVYIPKSDGGKRGLGIPSIFDRVCQQALLNRIERIFEKKFLYCSFGYRKGKSPHHAIKKIWGELNAGYDWIVDADLRGYFDNINQEKLIDLVAEEISDGRVLELIRKMLRAGVMEGDYWKPTLTGVPQGGVASPLMSNIYLHPFDEAMTKRQYRLTRWADDFVILCRTQAEAQIALETAKKFLKEKLGVEIKKEKTRIAHIGRGFTFLGFKIAQGKGELRLSKEKLTCKLNPKNLYTIPSEKSIERFMEQMRHLTRRRAPLKLGQMIEQINPVIRGWGNYYCEANVRRCFKKLDRWIQQRLYSFLAKRWRNNKWKEYPAGRLYEEYHLQSLIHLIPSLQVQLLPLFRKRIVDDKRYMGKLYVPFVRADGGRA